MSNAIEIIDKLRALHVSKLDFWDGFGAVNVCAECDNQQWPCATAILLGEATHQAILVGTPYYSTRRGGLKYTISNLRAGDIVDVVGYNKEGEYYIISPDGIYNYWVSIECLKFL